MVARGFHCCVGFSLVTASEATLQLPCADFSLQWLHLLQRTDPKVSQSSGCSSRARAHRLVVPHGLSFSSGCGIFPDQGSNPFLLHCQVDSSPLHHQGSPKSTDWKKRRSQHWESKYSHRIKINILRYFVGNLVMHIKRQRTMTEDSN